MFSLISASYSDGSIKVWNTTTHELVVAFAGHKAEVTALCFNSDATTLVSGAKDSDIIVWFALLSLILTVLTLVGYDYTHCVNACDFYIPRSSLSPRAFIAVIFCYFAFEMIHHRDMHGEQSLVRLRGHKNAITEVVVLNATKTIVSASKDRLVKVWDLITQHCVQVRA